MTKASVDKTGWIDWQNSAAKEIMEEDMDRGGWLYGDMEDLSSEIIFNIYKETQPEFEDVVFSQFHARYDSASNRGKKRRARCEQEEAWMKHDRKIHPVRTHNARGELKFHLTDAHQLLREDVANGDDIKQSILMLWGSRLEYLDFDYDVFRRRVYQERKFVKLCNYMDHKRNEKRRLFVEAKQKELATKEKQQAKQQEMEHTRLLKDLEKREKQEEKERKKLAKEHEKREKREARERKKHAKEQEKREKQEERERKKLAKEQEKREKQEEKERKKRKREEEMREKSIEQDSKRRKKSLRSASNKTAQQKNKKV
ncbi:unnamed protein product [Cylindrotheca closterium]|uniref:Zn-dependent PLC domain-containing protein n=1 Tax=Cylindrotheca closterium TaxID=2856 RepID=A0AAD2FGQ1_9STRA|nr:unnamed protein product [Cylindrotheca closterium]